MVNPPERVAASVARKGEVRHVPEGGGRTFGKDLEGGTASVSGRGETTKSGHLNFEPGGMSTIKWRILYQDSDSNKASRGETNKSSNEILEMHQETCPDNFQLQFPSEFQSMCQVPSQLNGK